MIRSLIRMHSPAARHVLILFLILLTGACATQPVQTVVHEKVSPTPSVAARSFTQPALLRPGDQVEIFVWGYNDFSRRATVNFNGSLPYPMLGELPVAGKSVAKVEQEIRTALADYIKDPIVRVSVVSTRPQKLYVLGEVKSAGAVALNTPDTTLVEAIALAGGMTADARESEVIVVRNAGEQIKISTVDFRRITREGDLASNLLLADGDIVYVPVAYSADIAREARRVADIVAPLLYIENATILFEGFTKALTHAPDRPGAPQTTVVVPR